MGPENRCPGAQGRQEGPGPTFPAPRGRGSRLSSWLVLSAGPQTPDGRSLSGQRQAGAAGRGADPQGLSRCAPPSCPRSSLCAAWTRQVVAVAGTRWTRRGADAPGGRSTEPPVPRCLRGRHPDIQSRDQAGKAGGRDGPSVPAALQSMFVLL